MRTCLSIYASTLFAGLLSASLLAAATPVDELLRLTPSDVTLVVVANDLRSNAAAIRGGPFATAFLQSKLGQALVAKPELKHLDNVVEEISRGLHTDWSKVRDELIGDAVVLAYRGGPPNAREQETGLVLTWTRDTKLATELLDRITAAQRESGELREIETRNYLGTTYVRRVKSKGGDDFLFRNGTVLAFSGQEEMIRKVIELDRHASRDKLPPLGQQLESLQVRDAAISLWLNPRYFDADLIEKAHAAVGNDAAFLAKFVDYWKGVSGVALACRFERHLELSLSVAVRNEAFPPSARRVGEVSNEPSALAAMFPADSLTTILGRLDLPSFIETISGFVAPDAWATLTGSAEQAVSMALGKKNPSLLSSQIGPDWGICFMPPATPKGFLPDAVAAVRIKPSSDGAFEKSILGALDALAMFVSWRLNPRTDDPVRVESRQSKEGDIKFLSCDKVFPPGIRPAWSLRSGFLAIGTSPEAIEQAVNSKRKRAVSGANRLVTVSFREWHRYLTSHRADLTAFLPTTTDLKADEIASRIDDLTAAFELFDRVELVGDSQKSGLIKLSLRLYPIQPLKN